MQGKSGRRAPGMTPQQRREMIVRTALPLVTEHGTAVTTGQIARAAGIGEATIFRVFADKDELLDACVAEALRTDLVLSELASIPLDQPLPARLAEAGAAIDAYLTRMGQVIGALHLTGGRPRPRPAPSESSGAASGAGDERANRWLGREDAMSRTHEVLAELFEPERDRLRLPADQLAAMFMGLVFGRARPPVETAASVEDYVDVFLHGALGKGASE